MTALRHAIPLPVLLLAPVTLRAQHDSTTARADSATAPADSTDPLIAVHDFTGGGEFLRVFLQAGMVYQAELKSPDFAFVIRPLRSGVEPPFMARVTSGPSASGGAVYEIYPREDAEYEIRPAAGYGITTLALCRDVEQSRRRQRSSTARAGKSGWRSRAGSTAATTCSGTAASTSYEARSGGVVEACFSARNAPSASRVSGCAVGFGYEWRPSARDVVWAFIEPRLRVIGGESRGKSNTELGVLFGAGLGDEQRGSSSILWQLTPGDYVARHLRRGVRRHQGGGLPGIGSGDARRWVVSVKSMPSRARAAGAAW
ncbi:MAG TPA: hypothetical protein VNK43_05165 [Gemmatimonadales bacterium]|nr:hypothetical protein [Gemmatimonadales bacterium]